ncbi:MAG: hypothetical protein PHD82_01775 [Candidatus Riflebacteria bacterium]|jgi:type IV secretory pathway VirB2 component (pilin)|nr:hypothetical protein [Candidatus Riflebacteria bacterium]
MATGDCEKIIEEVSDPKNLNDQCRQHIKTCKECAAMVACLAWVKTKGSPTADMQPSQAFLNRIEQSLNGNPSGGGAAATGGSSTLLAWILGIAITASVFLGIITMLNPAASVSLNGVSAAKPTDSIESATKTESRILNTQTSAPVLKFSSPADDVD